MAASSSRTGERRLVNRFVSRRRVTIAEVAARAGVSKTTVSHVLSGNRPVAAATRVRVERAVRDLGYRPDHLARSLRTQRSAIAALVIPDITNPFFPVVARGSEGLRRCVISSELRLLTGSG